MQPLNQKQRLFAVVLYLLVFIGACFYFNENSRDFIHDSNSPLNIIFISGALLLVFGSYIAEPYFTKPVDMISNSMAIILALLSINDKDNFIGYNYLYIGAWIILLISVILILGFQSGKYIKWQKITIDILSKIGNSKGIFSIIYIFTLFSFFGNKSEWLEFSFFLTFWAIVITGFVVENIILYISKIRNIIFSSTINGDPIGTAIGCENPYLYKVEINTGNTNTYEETKQGDLVYLYIGNHIGVVGIIINHKHLLGKGRINVYLLEHDNKPLKIDLKKKELFSDEKSIYSMTNTLYKLNIDNLENSQKEKIKSNYLFQNKDLFVGYVISGSDISKIKFHALLEKTHSRYTELAEGSVIKTNIYNQETLFQIIDGKTNEEQLEQHNIYGYRTGIAQKIGKYNIDSHDITSVKWLPNIYSPIFFNQTVSQENNSIEQNPNLSIGKLPNTEYKIDIKDIDSLVTHNTAILGILGIGKSCLTFELIKNVINNTDCKIICIDITNEYHRELSLYVPSDIIQLDITGSSLTELRSNNNTGNTDPNTRGNETLYKTKLNQEFEVFIGSDKKVLILNPDWHPVSKAGSNFNITHKIDLTIAEKTRHISERLFMLAKSNRESLGDAERSSNESRLLIIFEEAHSLIPERSSTANEGDKSAVNGTAKVILQGRKYGLGSFVITQRTANISKSILNQCNTIFALRVFDDTGKQFLENYIGSDYSNILPTLEERHAIVVGKALKLKQPIILSLNDKSKIIEQNTNE